MDRDPRLESRRSSRRTSRRSSNNTVGVIVGGVALVAVLAVAGYFGVRAFGGSKGSAGAGSTTVATSAVATTGASTTPPVTPAKTTPKPAATTPASTSATTAPVPVADPATDQAVTVLMYHHIMPTPSNTIAISPATFDAQMGYLKDHGFHPVTIAQMNDFVLTGKRLPEKPVLITFDDGRMNQLTYGVPILKKYGFPATFFVVKKWIVTTSPSFMHVPELKQLLADGFDVQSHTANHIQIHPSTTSSGGKETYAHFKARYWDPLANYRTWLQQAISGPDIFAMAYPGGRFNPEAEQLAGEAGYTLSFTTNDGYVTYKAGKNAEMLPRWNTGARGTTLATFAYIVNGAARAAKSGK